jgi:hypothetical protein
MESAAWTNPTMSLRLMRMRYQRYETRTGLFERNWKGFSSDRPGDRGFAEAVPR